ncbi:formyltetrahydrofolate-dependent phosphoribosylglycinamide formyltransferase [Pontibacter ummariensis]|uniref:Phosphoribosylglycinamide formyltransferase n=1 Tax=Pontibacter ummariensis TaxID=1610492 RepID=A0A239HH92_9BACT|nr:phosphoribosylglycinamide formyltransferase [Pontibacter ummariensis]PRY10594.1 formyltetrahydrofolate-dependent phosphoribosylglycinamide formyltransferase [Pontibacter ummariensis]SNS80418.1 formyltetrahydrofolate-dependent phosphoribosylglycinamide formyltransferase [Pontibacter ummariensis]
MKRADKKNIVIFASGSGSNAQRLLEHFEHHPEIRVAALFSNNPKAYALQRAETFHVPALLFSRDEFYSTNKVVEQIKSFQPDLIVLAGFLWLVPQNLLQAFPNRIINIHPALLPQYGGKGMHGLHVHAAVVQAGEKESGITIHHINEEYDKGEFILQERCPVLPQDTPEELAARVLQLEHKHLPLVVEKLLLEKK